jgi:ferredoxin-NADP reductase
MKTTLKNKELVAEGTMAFHFAKPDGFVHTAGQSIDLTLINPPETDDEGNMRAYSLASAPEEPDLMIATRLRDTAFKRVLQKLESGAEVNIEGPFGDFILHENVARPAVFIAGGIGITPFRSMAVDAASRSLPHKIFLFSSNRRPEDAPFIDELAVLAEKNKNFTFIPRYTNQEGYLTADAIHAIVAPTTNPIYYLAGPQAMVLALRDMLKAGGVSGDDIRYEEFTGY